MRIIGDKPCFAHLIPGYSPLPFGNIAIYVTRFSSPIIFTLAIIFLISDSSLSPGACLGIPHICALPPWSSASQNMGHPHHVQSHLSEYVLLLDNKAVGIIKYYPPF